MLNTNSTRTYEARQLTLLYFLWQVRKGKLVIMRKTQHLRTHFFKVVLSIQKKGNYCVGREFNPGQLLGRQLSLMPTTIPQTL